LKQMKLFDDIERGDHKLNKYNEAKFNCLNLNGSIEFDRVRCELEEWFSHYQASDQTELRARFRSSIDVQHQAAFFELFLHELLLKLSCKVTVHPIIPNRSGTPDFLVESPDHEHFYIEATIASNESVTQTSTRARMNAVYDVLDREVNSPDFSVWIRIDGAPSTPPPAKRIASFINAHLSNLDPDVILNLYESGKIEELPQWTFNHDGWKIGIVPIPKKPETRGKPGVRPIGIKSTSMQLIDDITPIRDAIIEKAGRYGELDLPFVVAVNVLALIDETEIMQALFGKEQFTVFFSPSEPSESTETQVSRLPDGAWIRHGGPRYTRVSAVLFATLLSPYNFSRVNLHLYHNPWSQRPYKSVLTRLTQIVPRNNQMLQIDGESIEAIFGLPKY
jgi:hypothetical protein